MRGKLKKKGSGMKNMLKRYYLEEFFEFCQGVGGETAETMGHILKLEVRGV